MDLVNAIMEYEDGTLDEENTIAFFQDLLDTGMIRTLQGSYQRMAYALLTQGLITLPEKED